MPKDPKGSDVITAAILREIKAIKELEPLLSAITVSNLRGVNKIIAALAKVEAGLGKDSRSSLLANLAGQLTKLRDLMVNDNKASLAVIKNNAALTSQMMSAVQRLESLKLDVDLTGLIDAIDNFGTSLDDMKGALGDVQKGLKGVKVPIDDNRVAVKLSKKDIEALRIGISGDWRQRNSDTKLLKADGSQVINPATEETLQDILNGGKLVPEEYDEIVITYRTTPPGNGEINTVVYKLDGDTVATLTLAYDGSDRLSGVVRT